MGEFGELLKQRKDSAVVMRCWFKVRPSGMDGNCEVPLSKSILAY